MEAAATEALTFGVLLVVAMRMMCRRMFRDLVRIFVVLGEGRRRPECQKQKHSGKNSLHAMNLACLRDC